MAEIYDTARSRAAASANGTETCEDMFGAFNEIKNNPDSKAKKWCLPRPHCLPCNDDGRNVS